MKQDRWKQLADELGGYVVRKWSWGWVFNNYRVVARHKNWPLTFYILHHGGDDNDPNTPNHSTGIRASFATNDGLRLIVSPKVGPRVICNLVAKRHEKSGLHEGSLGSEAADERFAVFSNNPDCIKSWLEDEDVEKRLLNDPTTTVLVFDDQMWFQSIPARGCHELHVLAEGLIPLEQLRVLHDLTTRLLDRLRETGIASEEDPASLMNDVPGLLDRGWGKIALALGVAGMCLPLLGIPFALSAWILGSSDLKQIKAGEIPWSRRNVARLAKITGGVGIAFQIIWTLFLTVGYLVMT